MMAPRADFNATSMSTPRKSPHNTPPNINATSMSMSPHHKNSDRRNFAQRKVLLDKFNTDILQICLDVPYIEHPYLIGPGGRKAQFIMNKYRSLIHFPDSNCRPGSPKINNVVITGSMKSAEEIRSQLRDRTPIRLAFHLNCFKDKSKAEKIIQEIDDAIVERSLPIRMTCQDNSLVGILKTEWRNEEALANLCDQFITPKIDPKNIGFDELYTIGIALLPLINPWNPEISYRLVGMIREQTGCQIFYPPIEKYTNQPPSYFIKGKSVAGVLRSARYLIGLSMFQISFYIPMNDQALRRLDPIKISGWQRDLLVHTSIEPIYHNNSMENGVACHKVVLRSFEFCVNSVYTVRSQLLGFKKSYKTPAYDFMSSVKYMIPSTVFVDARLCYPLFSIDDERHTDVSSIPPEKFFDTFYGGPFNVFQSQLASVGMTYDERLTKNLPSLLNLNVDPNANLLPIPPMVPPPSQAHQPATSTAYDPNTSTANFLPVPFIHQSHPVQQQPPPQTYFSTISNGTNGVEVQQPIDSHCMVPASVEITSGHGHFSTFAEGAFERAFNASLQYASMCGMNPPDPSTYVMACPSSGYYSPDNIRH